MPAKFGWLIRSGSSVVVCQRLIEWETHYIFMGLCKDSNESTRQQHDGMKLATC